MASPGDRVIIQVETVANLAGINAAKGALAGLGISTMATAAALAILFEAAKSMVDISEEHRKAEANLTLAIEDRNAAAGKTTTVTVDLTKLIKAHDAALRSLAEVEAGMPTKHKATTLELMHLQDAHKKVTETATALAKAQAGETITTAQNTINIHDLNNEVQTFLETNRGLYSSQVDVINGFAAFVREGVPAKDLARDMTTAMNIAAVEGISLSDAVGMLQSAESGRNTGLKKLVGITLEAIPANATLAQKEAIVSHNMDIAAAAYKGGTAALTPLNVATNALSSQWQDLANKWGPGLVKEMTAIVVEISKDMPIWVDFLTKVYNVASQLAAIPDLANQAGLAINDALTGRHQSGSHPIPPGPWSSSVIWNTQTGHYDQRGPLPVNDYVDVITGVVMNAISGQPANAQGKASGGPVFPGQTYTVGERGPETLVMGSGSGSIVPNGAGGIRDIHIHVDRGAFIDGPSVERLSNEIARRLSYVTGR